MAKPQRTRGRPKGGRAFERGDVVNAALTELANGGYAALTMRGVARSVGASLATVQRHFATKDDLWRGAVDAVLDRPEFATSAAAADPLRAAVVGLLGAGAENPGLLASVIGDRAPGHAERFAYLADRLGDRHAAFHQLVSEFQATGALRNFDAKAMLLLLNVGIGSIASATTATREIYGFDLEDPADRDRLAAAITDILRSGIVARPSA